MTQDLATGAFFGAFCKHWSIESCNMPGRWEAGRNKGVEDVEAGRRPNVLLTEDKGDGLRHSSGHTGRRYQQAAVVISSHGPGLFLPSPLSHQPHRITPPPPPPVIPVFFMLPNFIPQSHRKLKSNIWACYRGWNKDLGSRGFAQPSLR